MKLALKEFQEDTVAELIKRLRQAKRDVLEGDTQAVVLASPTGSGKTVMVAAAIEEILDGSDRIPAEPEAVFLWLSNQPELNEQSRKRLTEVSSRLRESDLIIVDASYDQETFDGGKVYFLNTQKLVVSLNSVFSVMMGASLTRGRQHGKTCTKRRFLSKCSLPGLREVAERSGSTEP